MANNLPENWLEQLENAEKKLAAAAIKPNETSVGAAATAVAAAEAAAGAAVSVPKNTNEFARDFEHAIDLGLDLAKEVQARAKQPYTKGFLLSKKKKNINRTTVRFSTAGKDWTNVERVKSCFESLFVARDAFVEAVKGDDFGNHYATLREFLAKLRQSGMVSKNFRGCHQFTRLTTSNTFQKMVAELDAHFTKKIVPRVTAQRFAAQVGEHMNYLKALDWVRDQKEKNNARRLQALKARARNLGIFILGGGRGGRTRRRSRRAKV